MEEDDVMLKSAQNTKEEVQDKAGQHEEEKRTEEPPITRRMVLLTVCLYIAFCMLGLANSLGGPSLVHLSYLYHTDIAGISLTFTFNAIGYLIGSVTCALAFDRFNPELQFFLACLDMGLLTLVAPWSPNLYGYCTVMGIANVGKGFIDAAGQSYVIRLWHGHRYKNPAMQGIHAIWAVGAFICPLIIAPFLVDLPSEDTTTTDYYNSTLIVPTALHLTHAYNSTTTTTFQSSASEEIEGLTRLRYPFAIVGLIGSVLSLSFFSAFCVTRKQGQNKAHRERTNQQRLPGDTKAFQVPIMTMQVLFYFFYLWYELIPGGLISAFVIKGLEWPVPSGPRITSLYWGSSGIGRVVGIPISAFFSPASMITFNIALTSIAFILLSIAANTSDILVWISVSMAGFGMSTTFASAILWTSNHMTITGAIGATFLIAASAGSLTGPALAGFLFETHTHMWVVYLSLLSCFVHIALFTCMYLFARVFEKKVQKKCRIKDVEDKGDQRTLHELQALKSDEIFSSAQHL